jgi:hypothetical protein
MIARRWWCLGCLAVLVGCSRAAPDPERCEELSLIWHGLMSPGERGMPQSPPMRLPPEIDASVRRMTLRCITEPFDARFVRCMNEGNPRLSCAQYLHEDRLID